MSSGLTSGLHLLAAAVCVAVAGMAVLLLRSRAALLPAVACAATGIWAAAVAFAPGAALGGPTAALEVIRVTAWLALLLGLGHAIAGSLSGLERRFLVVGAVLALIALAALPAALAAGEPLAGQLGLLGVLARVALALLVVLVAENLYRNADEAARWHVNLPCIALGGLAAFDVLIYAEVSLSRGASAALLDARAGLTALAVPLLGIGALRARRFRRQPGVSRAAAFHGATFLVSGAFLVAVGAAGETLRRTGAEWSEAAQIILLAAAPLALLVAASSRSIRSRLRRIATDHFFAARFDYRREWLRAIATLAEGKDGESEAVRAIRAVADSVDSPGGVLLRREPGEDGLRWAGSWNCPSAPLPIPPGHRLLQGFGEHGWVQAFGAEAPEELHAAYGRIWLAVPLIHHSDGLVGAVLLAPPRAPFALDREVFELLRMVGREVALFLAERRAAERLAEQRRLEDYAKRFAFVAHDIKNVANQLTLVLANAERNIDDPEFQRDMLFTIRRSTERINTLIARLRQPQDEPTGPVAGVAVAPLPRLRALARAQTHPVVVEIEGEAPGLAAVDPDRFEAAVGHFLDNAIEASPQGEPVRIVARRGEGTIIVEITDRGPGMTAEFVRDELFRPLSTSKPSGSGIGAWQARDLLEGAGAAVAVQSAPGAGTTIRLTLPTLRLGAAAEPVRA